MFPSIYPLHSGNY